VVHGYRLEGPYPSRQAGCATALPEARCASLRTVKQLAKARAPFLAVEVAVAENAHEPGTLEYGLFVQLAKGWYAQRLGTEGMVSETMFPIVRHGTTVNEGGIRKVKRFFSVPSLTIVDVSPRLIDLVLHYDNPHGGFRDLAPTAEQVQVCGIGASGSPRCTEVLFLSTTSRQPMKSLRDLFAPDHQVESLEDERIETKRLDFE
jgi:hypothetical protein